ncbi:MAG: hypothetical protein NTV54_02775 [Ignavibacteriales bacterium]|nr:hypothetical protein [Ignavibacteriales bacterium]
MKNSLIAGLFTLTVILFAACNKNLDPLSPGSADGQYALGIKALVPLVVGNVWTYNVVLYDTSSGAERARYSYTLSVVDTVTVDTTKISLPSSTKKSLTRDALRWYVLQGELGVRMCWQVDSVENLRIRKNDDARFSEQVAFNFRASVGDTTPARYIGADTSLWMSGDNVITGADSVKTTLTSKIDTLRTTLGSAPYFRYRQIYATRTDFTNYYFKPGFGLILMEKFQRKQNGAIVHVRRDELASYYFK